jgi:hypothetical protein
MSAADETKEGARFLLRATTKERKEVPHMSCIALNIERSDIFSYIRALQSSKCKRSLDKGARMVQYWTKGASFLSLCNERHSCKRVRYRYSQKKGLCSFTLFYPLLVHTSRAPSSTQHNGAPNTPEHIKGLALLASNGIVRPLLYSSCSPAAALGSSSSSFSPPFCIRINKKL